MWDAVGWCEGIIKAVNTDARKIITRGEPANFFVYYLVDDDTSKHNLTLDGYGANDRWAIHPHDWSNSTTTFLAKGRASRGGAL